MTEARLAEFRELLNKRDCAAYRAAASLSVLIAYVNMGEVQKAEKMMLQLAEEYRVADDAITKFHKTSKPPQPEGSSGNSNPAQVA